MEKPEKENQNLEKDIYQQYKKIVLSKHIHIKVEYCTPKRNFQLLVASLCKPNPSPHPRPKKKNKKRKEEKGPTPK